MTARGFSAGWFALMLPGLLIAAGAEAVEPEWGSSWAEALATAGKADRIVLANFTGSDWSALAKKMDSEVFNTAAFKSWAADRVVLLTVDFPKSAGQPETLKRQNQELLGKFRVQGVPTIIFATPDGEEIGRSGYLPGGAEAWIKNAQAIIDSRPIKPELKPLTSLTEGLARATKDQRPLLLIAADGPGEPAAEELFKSPEFVSYARARLLVVYLKTAGGGDDVPVLAQLAGKHQMKGQSRRIALLDVAADKLLYNPPSLPDSATLIAELEKVLPPIPYDGQWLEDYDKAKLIAAARKKVLMLNFTGSDWCVQCKLLDKEVFETAAFKDYAKEKLVLVQVDFPRKTPQSPELKAQNKALLKRFPVDPPTLIFLDPAGKPLGQLSYIPGGPAVFLARTREIVK